MVWFAYKKSFRSSDLSMSQSFRACINWVVRHLIVKSRHDDIIKWKHFPRYWPFLRGIHRSLLNSPHKGQWRGALMFPLICVWMNCWVINPEASDSKRHRAHYDVTVIVKSRNCEIGFRMVYHSEIGQSPGYCCWGTCQISERSDWYPPAWRFCEI